jgi:lipopolysaccharide export system protein LptA|tara:strand:+ start:4693 stop:6267 length:1575 start_codon:yes stop_codon:yes gene_type:complete
LKLKLSIIFILLFNVLLSQEKKIVQIIEAGSFDKNEITLPGANILKKNNKIRVHLLHDGMDIWSDYALFYKKNNSFKARGNVVVKQGDSIELYSEILDYDGNERKIIAKKNVVFNSTNTNLKTQILFHDRELKEIYFEKGGVVRDSSNTIKSTEGKYYLESSKYEFNKRVNVYNDNTDIKSKKLDYYSNSNKVFFYGPTVITGEDYRIFSEKGFYNTKSKNGFFNTKAKIEYSNRTIEGDSLIFDDLKKYASGTKNVTITDTINKTIIKGDFAEVFKELDSAMVTKNAYAIKLLEKDSLFIKADTLFALGPDENRFIKGRYNVKFFKTNMSGKSDKFTMNQKSGLIKLIRNKLSKREQQILTSREISKKNPVIWNGESQMTGDEIHIIRNLETNQLDSLKILNNAFVIEKDSFGIDNYNQIKGIDLFGNFKDNELEKIRLDRNTEMIYYLYDEESKELIGIDKAICSSILMTINNNKIDEIIFYTNPEGKVYPESELEINQKILNGFNWRIKERILNKKNLIIK